MTINFNPNGTITGVAVGGLPDGIVDTDMLHSNVNVAKAWINYNGTGTVAIRDSFNVSSLTDNGTGLYTITFTNAMSNDDYCVQCTSHMWIDNSDDNSRITGATKMSTTSFRQSTIYGTGSYQDAQNNMATVFGD